MLRMSSEIGDQNVDVFDVPQVAAMFHARSATGYGDHGERAALLSVATDVRGTPILDVGVGGGRTTWPLRLLSDDYVGIDAAPNMVSVFRQSYPDVDVRLADARDLREFADEAFGFALFSNNGLDALSHGDRARALSEMARVVRPGGIVLYSTHNLHGPSFDERPWQRVRTEEPATARSQARATAQLAWRSVRSPAMYPAYWRNRRIDQHDGWATGPLRAHGFNLVAHFIAADRLEVEVRAAGLQLTDVFTLGGERIDPVGPESHTHYFHVIARKTAGA